MPAVKMPDGKVVMLSDDPQEGAKQFAELELLASPSAQQPAQPAAPQQPNSTEQIAGAVRDTGGVLAEAGKGMARGFVGMGKAIGEGLAPPPGTVAGVQMAQQPNPDVAQLKGMFDRAVAPSADGGLEKGAGYAGEVAGSMFFPGMGAATGGIQSALGPGKNEFAIPGLTGITNQFPQVAKATTEHIENGPSWIENQLVKAGLYASGLPRTARWALRYGYGALRNKILSGSEPGAALAPKTVPQTGRRMGQGVVGSMFSDNND